jgi:hypothetical protein
MAEAPASSESPAPISPSPEAVASPAPEVSSTTAPETVLSPENPSTPSPSRSEASEKQEIKAVLESPELGAIINADSRSTVFALDQSFTVLGDNGLTAKFTFNPSAAGVFNDVVVEVEIDGYVFEFEPANTKLFVGKNPDSLDFYALVGDATYVFDEYGNKWSESTLGKSRFVLEVVTETNGTSVKSAKLTLYSQ